MAATASDTRKKKSASNINLSVDNANPNEAEKNKKLRAPEFDQNIKTIAGASKTVTMDNKNLEFLLPHIEEDAAFLQTLKLTEDLRAIPAEKLIEAMQKNFQYRLRKADQISQSRPTYANLQELQIATAGALQQCFVVLTHKASVFERLCIDFANQAAENQHYPARDNKEQFEKENIENREIVISPVNEAPMPNRERNSNPNLSMLFAANGQKLALWNLKIVNGWFKTRTEQSAKKRIAKQQGSIVSKNPTSVIIEDLSWGLRQVSYVINSLTFSNCEFSFESFRSLTLALQQNSSLTELVFDNVKMGGSAGVGCLARALYDRHFPITKLRIRFDSSIEALTQIVRMTTEHQKVESLNLAGSNIDGYNNDDVLHKHADEQIINAFEFVPTLNSMPAAVDFTTPLRELDLSGIKFPKNVAESIFLYVEQNNYMRRLKYNNCISSPAEAEAIARHIANCLRDTQSLTSLELDDNHLGDRGVSIIAKALMPEEAKLKTESEKLIARSACSIEELSFRRNNIANKGFAGIANMLEVNKILRTLHVDGNARPNAAFSEEGEGYRYLSEAIELHNTTLVKFSPDPREYRGDYELGVEDSLRIIKRVCANNRRLEIEKASLWARIAFQVVAERLRLQLERECDESQIKNTSSNEITKIDKEAIKKKITSQVNALWTIAHEKNSDGLIETRKILQGPLAEIFKLAGLPTRFATEMEHAETLELQSQLNQWAMAIRKNPLLLLIISIGVAYPLSKSILPLFSIFLSKEIRGIVESHVLLLMSVVLGWYIANLNEYEQNRESHIGRVMNSLLENIGMIFAPMASLTSGIDRDGRAISIFSLSRVNYNCPRWFRFNDMLILYLCGISCARDSTPAEEKKLWSREKKFNKKLSQLLEIVGSSLRQGSFLFELTAKGTISIPAGVMLALLEQIFPRQKEFFHTLTWSAISAKILLACSASIKRDYDEGNIATWSFYAAAALSILATLQIVLPKRRLLQHYSLQAVNSMLIPFNSMASHGKYLYQKLSATRAVTIQQIPNTKAPAVHTSNTASKRLIFRYKPTTDASSIASQSQTPTNNSAASNPSIASSLLFDYKKGDKTQNNTNNSAATATVTAAAAANAKKRRSCLSSCTIA